MSGYIYKYMSGYIYKYIRVGWTYDPDTEEHGDLAIPDGWEFVQGEGPADGTSDVWVYIRRRKAVSDDD